MRVLTLEEMSVVAGGGGSRSKSTKRKGGGSKSGGGSSSSGAGTTPPRTANTSLGRVIAGCEKNGPSRARFFYGFASCIRPDARLKRMRAASAVISDCVADELALANAFCALSISSIDPTPLLKRPNAML